MSHDSRPYSVSRRQVLSGTTAAALAGLAGCSEGGNGNDGNGNDTGNGNDDGNGSNNDNGSTDQSVDLTAWTFAIHTNAAQALAEQYDANNVEVVDQPPGDVGDKLVTSLQAQTDLPSISMLRNNILKTVSRSGGMLRISDVIQEHEDRLFTVSKSLHTVDGDWFSFPNDLGPFVLYYNADIFSEIGLPTEPDAVEDEFQTWDDYIAAGQQWQDETNNGFLQMPGESAANGIMPAIQTQVGGRYYNDSGEFTFKQEANVRAYEIGKQLFDIAEPEGWFSSQWFDNFREGNVPTLPGPAWLTGIIKPNLEGMSGDWRVAVLPAAEQGGARGSNFGGASAGVPLAIQDDERSAALDWGQFWHLSEASFNEKIKAGAFPAIKPEGAEQANATEAFFGGQQHVQRFVSAAEECPPQYARPSRRAQNFSRNATRRILSDGQPIQEVLDDVHEQILNDLDEEDKQVEPVN